MIDTEKILEVARKGVRRSAVFMGLGLNAGHDPEFKAYELTEHAALQFVPSGLGEEQIARFKTEFCRWIVGNGLRELVEAFDVFLDRVYGGFIPILEDDEDGRVDRVSKKAESFANLGLEKKLDKLRTDLSISVKYAPMILSVKKARNCLTHRGGRVGARDCSAGSELYVGWLAPEVWLEIPNVKCTRLDLPLKQPQLEETEGSLFFPLREKRRVFSLGTFVSFSAEEVAEICNFVLDVAHGVIQDAVAFARQRGVAIVEK